MVLALGTFLVLFGGTYSTPITVNYITECFPSGSALEVSVVMGVYRQVLGLSLPSSYSIGKPESATVGK